MSKHPLYDRYSHIMDRCFNKNVKTYKDYGGRGISICEEWLNNFYKFSSYLESLENYDKLFDGSLYEIDRINNDGDYTYGNIRIVSKSVNCSNRRTNRLILVTSPSGQKYEITNQKEFCINHNINRKTFNGWLNGRGSKDGWTAVYLD